MKRSSRRTKTELCPKSRDITTQYFSLALDELRPTPSRSSSRRVSDLSEDIGNLRLWVVELAHEGNVGGPAAKT